MASHCPCWLLCLPVRLSVGQDLWLSGLGLLQVRETVLLVNNVISSVKSFKEVLQVCRQLRDHVWILRVLALRSLPFWMVRAPVLTQPAVQALQGNLKDVTLIGDTQTPKRIPRWSTTCSTPPSTGKFLFFSPNLVHQPNIWKGWLAIAKLKPLSLFFFLF